VENLLWEEIRRRFRAARVPLPGRLLQTRLTAGDGWYALGLATDEAVRFQGFHAENLLIILDEASGIADDIWDAAEGVAVGGNNRILAIGNPLRPEGRFYRLFQEASVWQKRTISAMEHPNVTGQGDPIPGAVTVAAISERVAEWCEPAGVLRHRDGETEARMPDGAAAEPDVFFWQGQAYRPDDRFRARMLGEFPGAGETSLIPLRWIEAAFQRHLPGEGVRRAAVDVARFGDDSTVIGLRTGAVLVSLEAIHGADTMAVAGRLVRLVYTAHPETLAVDSIGLGAGVVDRLHELGVAGVEAVNVSLSANDSERFANRRAELYWGLRERFRTGAIDLTAAAHDERVREELAGIRYTFDSRGRILIESKAEQKRHGGASPDRADMLAMLFDGQAEALRGFLTGTASGRRSGERNRFRAEMTDWSE
jgi:hypothetical protein